MTAILILRSTVLLAILALSYDIEPSHAISPVAPGDFETWNQTIYFFMDTCLHLIIVGYPGFFIANFIIKKSLVKSFKASFRYLGYFVVSTYVTGIFLTKFLMTILGWSLQILNSIWPSFTMGIDDFFFYSKIVFYCWSAFLGVWLIFWIYRDAGRAKVLIEGDRS